MEKHEVIEIGSRITIPNFISVLSLNTSYQNYYFIVYRKGKDLARLNCSRMLSRFSDIFRNRHSL